MEKDSTFDSLVQTLGSDERKDLLDKISSQLSEDEDSELPVKLPEVELYPENNDLEEHYQCESFFLRIWIMIKSLFQSSTHEVIYNDYLVQKQARELSKQYATIYDHRTNTLLNGFYENLRSLYRAADFFKPAVTACTEEAGSFYVFLGSLLLPHLTEKINTEISPKHLPYTRQVTGELRLSLIRKLEETLTSMEAQDRNRLYAVAQSLGWLSKFTALPFEKVLARFSLSEGNSYTCAAEIVNTELSAIASVLCKPRSISYEMIQALYYFSASEKDRANEDTVRVFREESISHLELIKTFMLTVPIRDIASVAFHQALWYPDTVVGVEDWFVKFKNEWRKIFDADWETWLSDKKKYEILLLVQKLVDAKELFRCPSRPWETFWGGVNYSHDYSVGFMTMFFTRLYPEIAEVIKKLLLSGEFVLKENRNLLSEASSELAAEEQEVKVINQNLAEGGVWYSGIQELSKEKVRTMQTQDRMDTLMDAIESEGALATSRYGATLRELINILEGILGLRRTPRYDTLVNLDHMGNSPAEAARFKEAVTRCHSQCALSLQILKEVETVEKR